VRDFEGDKEISFYPKIYSHHWFELEHKSNAGFVKILSSEISNLFKNLNVESLIFFGDYDRNWISKFTESRIDNKSLIKSVDFFKKHKIARKFNGAVKVNVTELEEFVRHFYVLTQCDGGFVYYHFLDENENLLGYIHYSGEVRFDILTQEMDKVFLEKINRTNFLLKT